MVRPNYAGNGTSTLWIQRPWFPIVELLSGGSTYREIGEFMRRRFIIAAVSAAVVVAGFGVGAAPSYAACALPDVCSGTSTVTATLTGTLGTRSVATVAPITISSVTNATALDSTWDVTAAEVGRSGTNPWSLGATLSGGQVTSATTSTPIPAASFNIHGNTAPAPTGGGGTWAAGAGGNLANNGTTQVPLCSNSAQVSTNTYTGTYDCNGAITLTIPNGTANGVYTGTFVVTLNQ